MKQNLTFKSFLFAASIASICAFAFVNTQANATMHQPFAKVQIEQNKVESEDAGESREISVPDVTVLGRLWEIAQRLLEKAN